MSYIQTNTPADPALYPLRIAQIPFETGAWIEKGAIMITLEVADGRKVSVRAPVSGFLNDAPEIGRVYAEPGPMLQLLTSTASPTTDKSGNGRKAANATGNSHARKASQRIPLNTPDELNLYPLKVVKVLVGEGDSVQENQAIAHLQVADGRTVGITSRHAGIVKVPPQTGQIFAQPGQMAELLPPASRKSAKTGASAMKTEATAKPSQGHTQAPPPSWQNGLKKAQLASLEAAYRSEFGEACNGPLSIHPADRAVSAGIPFADILEFEKKAITATTSGRSNDAEAAITKSAKAREGERKDGYSARQFQIGNKDRDLYMIPAFISPVLDSIMAGGSIPTWKLQVIEEGMKQRPQCFEDAWDYMLPDHAELVRICKAHPPDFRWLTNRAAAEFGKAELERVLKYGFARNGRPSPGLWELYRPLAEKHLPGGVPETRPVDRHPTDYISELRKKPLNAGQRQWTLERMRARLIKSKVPRDAVLALYAGEAYEKHLNGETMSSRGRFWARHRLYVYVFPLYLLPVWVVVDHDGFEDNAELVVDPIVDVAEEIGDFFGDVGKEIAKLTDGLGNSGGKSVAINTAPPPSTKAIWTEQTKMNLASPTSLSSVDNGKRPTPNEAQRAAFQAWLEN